MIIKWIYVLVWSLGLLYASFSDFFVGEMNWTFQETMNNDAKETYIFPYIMAMLLFLIDTIYAFVLEKYSGKESRTIETLIGLAAFLFCFLMSLSYGKWVFFIVGWVVLTLIKLIKTDFGKESDIIPQVTRVKE